ncbi:MAG: DNA polymerase III subunit gamma/tau [Limnobacter sp.]|uniref:DNA polymerase III subunit gamma/tau n=1 Tax=Limnobacter sp. TaxID=2003368 RepID=UPI00391C9097
MSQTVSQALARKWRPRDFESLVGQDHVVRALTHALENQRLHHAYLFTGTRGVGKTTIARILAKAVNCEQGISARPCGRCQACLEIAQGRFVDLLEVDAATNTRVDEMRALLENAMYAPTAGRYKVYVIDEVHMLSTSAFNAMLKTLEEPPGHVLFILATTDPQKIPATVLSRCLQFGLRNLGPDLLARHLAHILEQEGVSHEPAALRLIGKAARGSVRDALSLTDQAIAYSAGQVSEATVRQMLGSVDMRVVNQILGCLAQRDGAGLVALSRSLAETGAPYAALLDELAAVAYRLSVVQLAGMEADEDPDEAALMAQAQQLSPEDLQLIYQIAVHARAELPLAPDDSVGFSMALLRMLAFRPGGAAPALSAGPANSAPAPVAPRPQVPSAPLVAKPVAVSAPVVFEAPKAVVPPVAVVSEPAVAAAKAPSVAPRSAPARRPLPEPAQWPDESQRIDAKGLVRQALVQAELLQVQADGDTAVFQLRTAIKTYTDASMVARVEAALSEHFGCTARVQWSVGEVQQTAAAVQSENRKQALQAARQSLDDDPFLQDISQMMGASIVAGSERSLTDQGPADV